MPKTATVTKTKEIKAALPFSAGDFVVYPAHGVGLINGVDTNPRPAHVISMSFAGAGA